MDKLKRFFTKHSDSIYATMVIMVILILMWCTMDPFSAVNWREFIAISSGVIVLTYCVTYAATFALPRYVSIIFPVVVMFTLVGTAIIVVSNDKRANDEAACLTDTVYSSMPYLQDALSAINKQKAEAMARITIANAEKAGESICPTGMRKWELSFRVFRIIHMPGAGAAKESKKPAWQHMYLIMRNAIAGRYEYPWPKEYECADDFDMTSVRWVFNSAKRVATRKKSRSVGTIGSMTIRCST